MKNKRITAGVLAIIYGITLLLVSPEFSLIVSWALIGLILWYFVGGVVLILIDNENRDLKRWLDSAPPLLDFVSICCFPVILFFWEKANHEGWWK